MQIRAIKRFVFNKITTLNNNCNVIDVLNLLDDYLIELDRKIKTSSSVRITKTQHQLKQITNDLIKCIENLTDKGVITSSMTPYKISNLIKLIDKINGEEIIIQNNTEYINIT